jgi:hypothetical protein
MNCPIVKICAHSHNCLHRDMAEYCSVLREHNLKELQQGHKQIEIPPPDSQ